MAASPERVARYGHAIWKASRADEGTISALGANIIAKAVLAVVDAERAEMEAERLHHHTPNCNADICVCPDDVVWARALGDDDPCAPGKDWAAAAFGEMEEGDGCSPWCGIEGKRCLQTEACRTAGGRGDGRRVDA